MALDWALYCWMELGAYWLVTWTRTKVTAEREPARAWMRHRVPLAAAYVLLLDSKLDRIHLSLGVLPAPAGLRAVGVAITLAGLANGLIAEVPARQAEASGPPSMGR